MRVTALDHTVLDVADVRRSLDFCTGTIIDLLQGERSGENLNHFCLLVDDDVEQLAASGALDVIDGPGERCGARGQGLSIYLKDPDGNVVELKNYR